MWNSLIQKKSHQVNSVDWLIELIWPRPHDQMSHVHISFYDKYNTLIWERFRLVRLACEERKRRSGCNKGSGRWNVQLVVIHRQKNSSVHAAVHVIHSDHGSLVLLDVTQPVGAQAEHIVGHYQRALWEIKVRIQWDSRGQSVNLSPLCDSDLITSWYFQARVGRDTFIHVFCLDRDFFLECGHHTFYSSSAPTEQYIWTYDSWSSFLFLWLLPVPLLQVTSWSWTVSSHIDFKR